MITLLGMPLAFSGLVIAYGFILGYGRAGFVTQLLGAGADPPVSAPGSTARPVWDSPMSITWCRAWPCRYTRFRQPGSAAHAGGAYPGRDALARLPRHGAGAGAPSVLANACLVAAIAMGTYGTALALAGTQLNILPLMLYAQIGDGGSDFGVAAALSLLLMALCVAVMGVGDALARRRR